MVCLLAGALAQEVDIAVGGSTAYSAKPTSASEAFQPPAERGGVFPSISAQIVRDDHFGINAEFAYRYDKALYNGYQPYRPAQYDINLVYAPVVNQRTKVDLMAGIGGQTTIFYNTSNNCPSNAGVCSLHFNTTHFAAHLGIDLRRYVWRNFFVRPELHYYRIFDNSEFHSDNLIRMGASIGYTWGRQ